MPAVGITESKMLDCWPNPPKDAMQLLDRLVVTLTLSIRLNLAVLVATIVSEPSDRAAGYEPAVKPVKVELTANTA